MAGWGLNGDRGRDVIGDGGGPTRRAEDPGRLWEPPAPKVSGDAPTAATHSSWRLDHAPRAELGQRSRRECAEELRECGTFKRPPGGRGLGSPAHHRAPPLARFLDPRQGALGASGGRWGVCAAGLRASGPRNKRQESRLFLLLPALGAAPAGRAPLPAADPRFLGVNGVGKGAFLRRGTARRPPRPLPAGCASFLQEGPVPGREAPAAEIGPLGLPATLLPALPS